MLSATLRGTAIVVHDNRKDNHNIKNDVDEQHQKSLHYSNQKHEESHCISIESLQNSNMRTWKPKNLSYPIL